MTTAEAIVWWAIFSTLRANLKLSLPCPPFNQPMVILTRRELKRQLDVRLYDPMQGLVRKVIKYCDFNALLIVNAMCMIDGSIFWSNVGPS